MLSRRCLDCDRAAQDLVGLRSKLGQVFRLFFLALSIIITSIGPLQSQEVTNDPSEIAELTIGVSASEGVTRALEDWKLTKEFLDASARDRGLNYRFKIEPYFAQSNYTAEGTSGFDLIFTDAAGFVAAEEEMGARALSSIAQVWDGKSYDKTGAVIFTRQDSNIKTLSDAVGQRIMGIDRSDFIGWKLAVQQFRAQGIDEASVLQTAIFSGGNQLEVVSAVQSGLVDVGVIRAGVLEKLAREGRLELDELRPISAIKHADYPFWVSTPIFPGSVLAALPSLSEEAMAITIESLLQINGQTAESKAMGGVVWQAPQNYQQVRKLLMALGARPYESQMQLAATNILERYKWIAIAVAALIIGSFVFLVRELVKSARLAEERRNVLASELRSKEFYRTAVEAHSVFCMLSHDGVITHVNEQFQDVMGLKRNQLIQHALSDFLVPENKAAFDEEIGSMVSKRRTWKGVQQFLNRNGKPVWLECTFIQVQNPSQEMVEIAMVASDVTKTREGISETRFNNTLELLQDLVIVVRPKTYELSYVNAAAQEILINGRGKGGWKGKKVSDFLNSERFEEFKERCLDLIEKGSGRATWEVEAKTGVTFEINLEYATPPGDEPRFIVIYRDITERKVAERAKKEFIATISHELRTPLTSIKGALGIIGSNAVGHVPEKMGKLVKIATLNCDRLIKLINDILDIEKFDAKKMDLKMEVFDLSSLVNQALEANSIYSGNLGVNVRRIDVNIDAPLLAYGNPDSLARVMDNLISNASKFSQKGDEIFVSLVEKDNMLRLSVRDFGVGIPQHLHGTIFERFVQADSSDTRSKGGSGLGLSIVREIIGKHQGRVYFVSKEKQGTEFFVDLPKVAANGEDVIPLQIETPDGQPMHDFTGQISNNIHPIDSILGSSAIQRLIDQFGEDDVKVNLETGKPSLKQFSKSKGVVGQVHAKNWFNDATYKFLDSALENKVLRNSDVYIIEVPARVVGNVFQGSIAAESSIQRWLNNTGDLLGDVADLKVLTECTEANVKTWLAENSRATVTSNLSTVEDSNLIKYDLLAKFLRTDDIVGLAIFPVQNGKLPEGWPTCILGYSVAAPSAGHGVVSKFSTSGGASSKRIAS